ncbi:MAG: thioredoxin domain-containing protein, partial [Dehalococcoidia bacterium]|nr:thioredoxin domain-containing protein [Dehalococcoidia bacterium]
MTSAGVIEATDETFEERVINASHERPIVVDFWATWCGPCQTLSPIIERVAGEHPEVQLVKVDVDQSPAVAQAFAIQSIPAVMAFRGGRVDSSFLGAMPEPDVRAFFDRLAPSEADRLVEDAEAALDAGDLAGARARFEAVLAAEPANAAAAAGLAGILIHAGDLDGAEALLAQAEATPQIIGQRAYLRFVRGALGVDVAAMQARLAADEDDVPGHYALGCVEAASGRWEEALE